MSIQLDVPYVRQLNIGGHAGVGWDDPTGCWYASVCMIGYFFESGPRMGLPEIFHGGHDALSQDWQDRLPIQREHLRVIRHSDVYQAYTAEAIQDLLANNGPILFYWRKNNYGHASVITGVDDAAGIVYHDPEFAQAGGVNVTMNMAAFNLARMFNPGVYGLLSRANLTDGQILTIRRKTVGRNVAAMRQRFGG
jgi:hypothetical protein